MCDIGIMSDIIVKKKESTTADSFTFFFKGFFVIYCKILLFRLIFRIFDLLFGDLVTFLFQRRHIRGKRHVFSAVDKL